MSFCDFYGHANLIWFMGRERRIRGSVLWGENVLKEYMAFGISLYLITYGIKVSRNFLLDQKRRNYV